MRLSVVAQGDDRVTLEGTRLSPRQEECLRAVLQLKSAKQIARDLGISVHAVEKHLRLCRTKYGVATTAEAARRFAVELQGSEFPQCDFPDLAIIPNDLDEGRVLGQPTKPSPALPEDIHGALSRDHPLTPKQTLLTIAAVSFLSIVGLLLLVACAEGIRRIVSS